jgi:DNA polymerase-1
MAETERDVAEQLRASLVKLNAMTSREINWNSPQQVASLLYGDLKLPVVIKTDKGAPSTGEEALLAIKGKHPIAEALVEYRELEKFRSTYLDGWKEFMVGPMLYLSTKLHGTVTGRYSSRLHQVPRDGTIRSLVEAPPGWTFVQGDLSQAELRFAAILSCDTELMTCYRRGIDVHWRTLLHLIGSGSAASYVEPAWKTAAALNGRRRPRSLSEALEVLMTAGPDRCTELWKGWKEARKTAKATNFGFLYGMMPPKFVETCKMKYGFEPTMKEAERMRETFFHLYQQLPDWHKKQKRLVHLNGYVRNLAGRMRRLPGIYSSDWSLSSECERMAINSPVQGYIGDHKAMAAIEIHETFNREKELRIVGEVHDALLMWVRTERLEIILPRVAEIMKEPKLVREFGIKLTVPLEADLTVGPWGSGKTWRPTNQHV